MNEYQKSVNDANKMLSDEIIMKMIEEELPLGIFWKDENRRFVGANRYFRDYYEFRDDSDFIGKTDEEMGWHVDPDPFMNDEYRVLKEGARIINAPGTCISHGQIRNILASKTPIRRDGKIVGLIGYFVDVTECKNTEEEKLAFSDEFTTLLSEQGFVSTYHYYVRAYMQWHSNFGILRVSFEDMDSVRDRDKVMRDIAKMLCDLCGLDSSLAYTDRNTFLIMSQISGAGDMETMEDHLQKELQVVDGVETMGLTTEFWSYRDASNNDPETLLNVIMS